MSMQLDCQIKPKAREYKNASPKYLWEITGSKVSNTRLV